MPPECLAPEYLDSLEWGKASDWWALGILLLELTIGSIPRSAIYAPQSLPYLSEECKDLIVRLLQKDPKNRMGRLEIEQHPFFADLDFGRVFRKEMDAPYKPSSDRYAHRDDLGIDLPFDSHSPRDDFPLVPNSDFTNFVYTP